MGSKKGSHKASKRGSTAGSPKGLRGAVGSEPLPAPALAPPFHAPFQELARALKLRPVPLPSPKPSPARASRPVAVVPIAPTARAPSPQPAVPILSDAEVLAASMAGVSPMAPSSARVRIRRRADLSDVEAHLEAARKEDLGALAGAAGFDVTFDDRYVRARAAGVSRETLSRLEKGEFRICAHLDLHGMPLEEARKAVDDFLVAQQKRGHRCVLLVTGKGKNSLGGRGVLREQVPEWLARGPSSRRVLAFASARPCDGGLGALVVLMRAVSSSKNRIDVEHGGVGPAGT